MQADTVLKLQLSSYKMLYETLESIKKIDSSGQTIIFPNLKGNQKIDRSNQELFRLRQESETEEDNRFSKTHKSESELGTSFLGHESVIFKGTIFFNPGLEKQIGSDLVGNLPIDPNNTPLGDNSSGNHDDLTIEQKTDQLSETPAVKTMAEKALDEAIESEGFKSFMRSEGLELKDLDIVKLGEGGLNVVYELKVPNQNYVLRLNRAKAPGVKNNFNYRSELEILESLSDSGIAPKIYFASSDILIMEKISGKHPTAEEIFTNERLTNLVSIIKKIHSIPAANFKNYNPESILEEFLIHRETSEELKSTFTPLYEELLQEFFQLPPNVTTELNDVVSHNDISLRNTIINEDRVRLIDFERVAKCSPFVDLANLALITSDVEIYKRILREYFGETTDAHLDALKVYQKLELIRRAFILAETGRKSDSVMCIAKIKSNELDTSRTLNSKIEKLLKVSGRFSVELANNETIFAAKNLMSKMGSQFTESRQENFNLNLSKRENLIRLILLRNRRGINLRGSKKVILILFRKMTNKSFIFIWLFE
jgi:aminoglycoside phosphotransferase (APT) family kinase protein